MDFVIFFVSLLFASAMNTALHYYMKWKLNSQYGNSQFAVAWLAACPTALGVGLACLALACA